MPPWSLPSGHTRNEDLRATREGVFALANSSTPQVVTGQRSEADFPDMAISVLRAAAQEDLVKVKVKLLSRVQLFATPWTVAYRVPPSMGFSRHEYWSGLPFPSSGGLPNPGMELGSPAL